MKIVKEYAIIEIMKILPEKSGGEKDGGIFNRRKLPREEREKIVAESLGNIEANCDVVCRAG